MKHALELEGKSTAIHAKVLAPNDVDIYTCDFSRRAINPSQSLPPLSNPDRTLFLYPSNVRPCIVILYLFH